jgi:hypothetical protein
MLTPETFEAAMDTLALSIIPLFASRFIDNTYMLLSHSRLLGQTAVTVVQVALPWQEQ